MFPLPLPWGKIVLLLTILAVVGGGYFWVNSLVNRLGEQERINSELGYKLVQEQTAHKVFKERVDAAVVRLDRVHKQMSDIRTERDKAVRRLADSRLEGLAAARPSLITRYARRATVRVWREFEEASNPDSGQGPLPEPAAN